MIDSGRAIFRATAFSVALLGFSPLKMAAETKDLTLRPANAASQPARLNGPRGLVSKGHRGLAANSSAKPVNLDPQLKKLENSTSKTASGKQFAGTSGHFQQVRTVPLPSDKIDFRKQADAKRGTANQLGQGSGSRRYGPGRRVTKKAP
jgi:hypothetical protein